MARPKWRLQGFDAFARTPYALHGEFLSERSAVAAARKRLADLEIEQPTAASGGQAEGGIQDRVFVVRPDGTRFRVT